MHPETSNISNPSERQVYSIDSTPGTNAAPVCVSCQIRTGNGEDCFSHSFSFSANFQFYTHTCRGPGVPEVSTKRTSVRAKIYSFHAERK